MLRNAALALVLILLFALAPAAAQPNQGGPFRMRADLNEGTEGSTIKALPLAGGALLSGTPVRYSDGTAAGTASVSGLKGGCYQDFSTYNAYDFGGQSYFCGTDDAHGAELWRSDGTAAGTTLLFDLQPGSMGSYPTHFTRFNNQLFFAAGLSIWRYAGNGTPVQIGSFAISSPLIEMNDNLYFLTSSAEPQNNDLWRLDKNGTATFVATTSEASGSLMVAAGNRLFFIATASSFDTHNQVWVSDGTPQGTKLLVDVLQTTPNNATQAAGGPYPTQLINWLKPVGNKVVWVAKGGFYPGRYGLWVSDGTVAGTLRLPALLPDTILPTADGRAFYGLSGEFFYSNGTVSGTVPLSAAYTYAGVFGPDGQTLYAATDNGLYRSDGTVAGTVRLFEGDVNNVFVIGSTILFTKRLSDTEATELWRTSGVPGDSQRLAEMTRNGQAVQFGQKLFFTGYDQAHGEEYWLSDGTAAGTAMLLDLNPGPNDGAVAQNMPPLVIDSRLIFTANDGSHGNELFATDGTTAGTVLLIDANTAAMSSRPIGLQTIGEKLFFLAQVTSDGVYQLHVAEGDTVTAIADLRVGEFAQRESIPNYPTSVVAGKIGGRYLALVGSASLLPNVGLWSSDGSAAGTELVYRPVQEQDVPQWLAFTSERAFFARGLNFGKPTHLYATEGTSATTVLLSSFDQIATQVVLADTLYFLAYNGQQSQLWRSDGTATGTTMVHTFSPDDYLYNMELAATNDRLYIRTSNQFWQSDGTPTGTTVLPNIQPISLIGGDDQLFFTQLDENFNPSLWTLDANQNARPLQNEGDFSLKYTLASGKRLFFVEELYEQINLEQLNLRVADAATGTVTTLLSLAPNPAFDPSAVTTISILGHVDNNLLFMVRDHPLAGLYRSDGTPAGTYFVQSGLDVSEVATANGTLYLSASDATYGHELWAMEPGLTLVAPSQVETQPGGTVTLQLSIINGGQRPTLSADPITMTVMLDPALRYVEQQGGPQPTVEGTTLYYSLPAGGSLSRSVVEMQLALAGNARLGSRYQVLVQTAAGLHTIDIVAVYRLYAPLVVR